MSQYAQYPFGNRPMRCEWPDPTGKRVVRWLTPRQMGMNEATIKDMERLEAEAEQKRRVA